MSVPQKKRTRVVAVLPASAFCRSSSSYQNSSRPGTRALPSPAEGIYKADANAPM